MPRPVVLLVDDVTDLLSVMAEVLALALPDHRVETAASGAEADAVIAAVEARGDALAVVIADQSLGDRTGVSLLQEVAARHPARLLLISGRASEEIANAVHAIGAKVLWKPFRMQALVDAVRD